MGGLVASVVIALATGSCREAQLAPGLQTPPAPRPAWEFLRPVTGPDISSPAPTTILAAASNLQFLSFYTNRYSIEIENKSVSVSFCQVNLFQHHDTEWVGGAPHVVDLFRCAF